MIASYQNNYSSLHFYRWLFKVLFSFIISVKSSLMFYLYKGWWWRMFEWFWLTSWLESPGCPDWAWEMRNSDETTDRSWWRGGEGGGGQTVPGEVLALTRGLGWRNSRIISQTHPDRSKTDKQISENSSRKSTFSKRNCLLVCLICLLLVYKKILVQTLQIYQHITALSHENHPI